MRHMLDHAREVSPRFVAGPSMMSAKGLSFLSIYKFVVPLTDFVNRPDAHHDDTKGKNDDRGNDCRRF